VRRGLIEPERGSGGAFLFTFQDLVTLRTARELFEADVPTRRVHAALEALREQLPVGRPLSAVTLSSLGDRVLVRDDDAVWEPDSGQLVIDLANPSPTFEPTTAQLGPKLVTEGPHATGGEPSADDWYDSALDLEGSAPDEAIEAYERAIELESSHSDAHLNLGRLHHEAGRLVDAEACYGAAIEADPNSGRAYFNVGVVREDLGREAEAIEAYERALRIEPELDVAHFNLSRLHERAGRREDALRHLVAYRAATGSGPEAQP